MTVTTNALLEGRTARTALIATDGLHRRASSSAARRARTCTGCATPPPAPLVPAELRFAAPERIDARRAAARARSRRRARARARARRKPSPRPSPSRCCTPTPTPRTSALLGELLAELLPDAQRLALQRARRHVPRVRAHRHDRARRGALAAARALPAPARRRCARRAACAEPQIMQSSGGLTDIARASAHAALTVLSGPAGGVGGALLLAELAGERDVLCFDMGGTSCDVCLIDGRRRSRRPPSATIAGRPLALPALDIHTVGAGGGSIAWRDSGGALRVGPQLRRRRPRARLLRARRHAADRHRREPAARAAARGLAARRRPAARPRRRRARRRRRSPASSASTTLALRRRHRARRRVRDARRAAPGDRRARHRPARLRADAVRRRRAAARLRDGARARHPPRALPARLRRALRARARRRRAAPRRLAHRPAARRASSAPSVCASVRDGLVAEADAALAGERARLRVAYELRYRGQSFELAVEQIASPSTPTRCARRSPPRTSSATATATTPPTSSSSTCACPSGARAALRPQRRSPREPRPGAHVVFGGARCRRVLRGELAPARVAGPRCARCRVDAARARRLGRRGRRARHDACSDGSRGDERARPDRAAGRRRRAARRVRGDGRRADPLGALVEHQGAPRRLDGAVRRRRADGHAGRAHPRAPRLDARRRRRRARRAPRARRLVDPQRPVRRRHAPARHHRHHARLRRRQREPRDARRSASPPAARTTPTSAGACPARCPPTAARSPRRAS